MTKNQRTMPQNNAPKPGTGPGAMPKKATTKGVNVSIPAASVSPVTSDPTNFGKVEEDGTVWVKDPTTGIDRKVGEWKAGPPEEGLAHFGARFDDLATEIATLETRLQTHPEEARKIRSSAIEHRGDLDSASVVGDLTALTEQLDRIINDSHAVEDKAVQARKHQRALALESKTKLADEAEAIATTAREDAKAVDWRASGDRFGAILDEWKKIRGLDRETDDQLWKRFSSAREKFNKSRGSHFAELDKARAGAKRVKEEIIQRAEAMQHDTDWGETAARYRELMQEWKAAGRAPRDVDDKLWARFRAAQDVFFNARKADQAERDQRFEKNADLKQALIDEYTNKINPAENLEQAKNELRSLQDKWEEIGFVPRSKIRDFEKKIGELEQRVADAEQAEWRRTDPETQARVAQFETRAADLKADSEAAAAAGNSKKAAELAAQADQWSQWAKTASEALGD